MEYTILEKSELNPEPRSESGIEEIKEYWVFHVNRSSNTTGSRVELVLTNLEGVVTKYALYFIFKASNNEAKYEALGYEAQDHQRAGSSAFEGLPLLWGKHAWARDEAQTSKQPTGLAAQPSTNP